MVRSWDEERSGSSSRSGSRKWEFLALDHRINIISRIIACFTNIRLQKWAKDEIHETVSESLRQKYMKNVLFSGV